MSDTEGFETSEESPGELTLKSIEHFRNEPIESDVIQRCKNCRRMKYGHPKPFGEARCKLERIDDDDDLRKDDEMKNVKRIEIRNKRKYTEDEDLIEEEIEEARKQQEDLRKKLEKARNDKKREDENTKRKKLDDIGMKTEEFVMS